MLNKNNFFACNVNITWKTFVRESCDVPQVSSGKKEHRLGFQGNEAREAYEKVIRQEDDTNFRLEAHKRCKSKIGIIKNNSKPKLVPSPEKVKKGQNSEEQVTINSILKAVEQKDLKFLVKHVTQENVNLTDTFGWTPLMSAAYCGHLDIIEFLVNLGANKEAREKSGLTAAQLALKKNYLNIVALLKKKTESGGNKSSLELNTKILNANTCIESIEPLKNSTGTFYESIANVKERLKESTEFYCETCKINFYQTTWKKHETSTLHIFNTKPKLSNAVYGISKQNKGYQMLLNTGWDEQYGLGPLGKGIKYPIKTYLKTDRKGFGLLNEKEYRVTHFRSGDATAVIDFKTSKQKCLKKKDRERLLNREVRKERVLRIALS